MNFSIPYTRKFNHFDQSNVEININYSPKVKQLENFIIKYKQKRINLIFNSWGDFDQERDPDLILAFRQKYPTCNLVMRLPDIREPFYAKEIQTLLAEKQLPHYYFTLANRWDIFNGLLETSVTDIYVTEDLCFSMDMIKQKAKEKNKKLRTFCNICQTSWPETNSLRTFFIRPEDAFLYNKYIDVVEFFNAEHNKNSLNVLYDLYNNGKRWAGPLNEIIKGFKGDTDSYYLIPYFGQKRLNCNKRCNVSTCSFCLQVSSLANTLKQSQIGIIYKNKNLQYNKEDEK